jgi:hypothetical protein
LIVTWIGSVKDEYCVGELRPQLEFFVDAGELSPASAAPPRDNELLTINKGTTGVLSIMLLAKHSKRSLRLMSSPLLGH